MERVSFIEHGGVRILYLDFSGCTVEEVYKVLRAAREIISSEPPNSLLTLTDVTGTWYDLKVVEAFKEFVAHNKPFVQKGCIVGIDGFKKVVYNAIVKHSGRNFLLSDDIEKAKNWLIDRRVSPRLEGGFRVEYEAIGKEGLEGSGITRDISMGGLCFDSEVRIEKETLLVLTIFLTSSGRPLKIKARVAWDTDFLNQNQTASYKVGVEFFSMSYADRRRLSEYIFGKLSG